MSTHIVYKYPLLETQQTMIELPIAAKVIHADVDGNGKVCIWVYQGLSEDIPTEKRYFDFYNTGQPLVGNKYSRRHIGTVKRVYSETFIYHVFEEKTL